MATIRVPSTRQARNPSPVYPVSAWELPGDHEARLMARCRI